jgi:ubiquitin fusion degradation protein 1
MMHGWGMLGGAGGGGYPTMRRFEEQYHCYSVAYADKAHLEKGDKVLLPPSAFDTLARLQVDYPMLFQLVSESGNTHCGVLEFTAEEGCVYIPFWMMQNLLLEEGSLLTVKNVSLPKATFVKLQPQSVDFLEISNPRAVLEHALRNYSCVTLGDIIQLPYNGKNYHFMLKEVTPAPAACIIETDCNVDFDAPVGYQEPERVPLKPTQAAAPETKPEPEQPLTSTRIVDGKILRPDDAVMGMGMSSIASVETGATGVQNNAAIPQVAPTVEYWAVNAGDGARLDGKTAAPLKDAVSGETLNVRELRAAAAAKRSEEQNPGTAPVSKRKSRTGGKFSKLKQSGAFHGDANAFK